MRDHEAVAHAVHEVAHATLEHPRDGYDRPEESHVPQYELCVVRDVGSSRETGRRLHVSLTSTLSWLHYTEVVDRWRSPCGTRVWRDGYRLLEVLGVVDGDRRVTWRRARRTREAEEVFRSMADWNDITPSRDVRLHRPGYVAGG